MASRNLWAAYGLFLVVVVLTWLYQSASVVDESSAVDAEGDEATGGLVAPASAGLSGDADGETPLPSPGIVPSPAAAGAKQLPDGIAPFSAPVDGKLTDEHLQMFMRVARAARQTVSGRIDDLTMQWAEARAAESLGFDPKGYRWVQARVHLALIQNQRRSQAEATVAMRENLIAQVEQMRAEAQSENEKAIIEAELQAMLGDLEGTLPAESEAERYNRLLVQANLGPLREAVGLGRERLGPELTVIEEPLPGDAEEPEEDVEEADDGELFVPFDGPVGTEALDASGSEAGVETVEIETVEDGEEEILPSPESPPDEQDSAPQ